MGVLLPGFVFEVYRAYGLPGSEQRLGYTKHAISAVRGDVVTVTPITALLTLSILT